jgi:hypothetical protein
MPAWLAGRAMFHVEHCIPGAHRTRLGEPSRWRPVPGSPLLDSLTRRG